VSVDKSAELLQEKLPEEYSEYSDLAVKPQQDAEKRAVLAGFSLNK